MKHPSAAVRAIAMAWVATLLQSTSAHEITDNRATLALRDPTLLSVTLYIDYTTVLQRVLAPKASRTEFVLAMAAVEEVEFRRQVQRAHERLQAGTRLRVNGGQPTALARWSWPDIGSAHRRLRQQAMAAAVGAHEHEQPIEIRAEARSDAPIASASVLFGAEFGRVLVVWYRPRQVWSDAGRETTIRFD